jgi:hypothetical protein
MTRLLRDEGTYEREHRNIVEGKSVAGDTAGSQKQGISTNAPLETFPNYELRIATIMEMLL